MVPHSSLPPILLPGKVKLHPDKRLCKAENRKRSGNHLKSNSSTLNTDFELLFCPYIPFTPVNSRVSRCCKIRRKICHMPITSPFEKRLAVPLRSSEAQS